MLAEKIHRAMFDERQKEFIVKRGRCALHLRQHPKWVKYVEKSLPTEDEACHFEGIQLERTDDNLEGREVAENNGWKLLGCGIHRCAFKYKPDSVVKIAFSGSDEARNANKYEVSAYSIAEPSVKEFINPISAFSPSYKWVTMPLVKTFDYPKQAEQAREVRRALLTKLGNRGAYCKDVHLGNIGVLGGEPVLIDYGFGMECQVVKPIEQYKKEKVKPKDKQLDEFVPYNISVERKCTRNNECSLHNQEACVKGICKKPTNIDVDEAISKINFDFDMLPLAQRRVFRLDFDKCVATAEDFQNKGLFMSAFDRLEICKEFIEKPPKSEKTSTFVDSLLSKYVPKPIEAKPKSKKPKQKVKRKVKRVKVKVKPETKSTSAYVEKGGKMTHRYRLLMKQADRLGGKDAQKLRRLAKYFKSEKLSRSIPSKVFEDAYGLLDKKMKRLF